MNLDVSNIYFIGIGGIGMSALARYFNQTGKNVIGYDKTTSALTRSLENEGIDIHYTDLGENLIEKVANDSLDLSSTLVVITPAVPDSLKELHYFRSAGYSIVKRAEVLGEITKSFKTLAVAGTHGKTTTSTLLTHVLSFTQEKCNAFLGGISSHFNSNLLLEKKSPWMVVEADEYDRSFHELAPYASILTSTEADHLDIYNNEETLLASFQEYVDKINPNGVLIQHHSIQIEAACKKITYEVSDNGVADYVGQNLNVKHQQFVFDVKTPTNFYKGIQLGLPGIHNAENALSVIALCDSIGIDIETIRPALANFKGVKRRFEQVFKNDDTTYIDDYAHHPTAIEKLLTSVKILYPEQPIYVIFQPHLYSRTRDFMDAFASSLSQADEVILLPIYPAREEPIEGITSESLAAKMETKVQVLSMENAIKAVGTFKKGVLLTVGAGTIDQLVEPIQEHFT